MLTLTIQEETEYTGGLHLLPMDFEHLGDLFQGV